MNRLFRTVSFFVLLVMVLGACAPAPTPAPAQPPAATQAPAQPPAAPAPTTAPEPTAAPAAAAWDSSKCLKFGVEEPGGETDLLDPATIISGMASIITNQPFNRLLNPDSNFQLQPELATSWEPNADATEWTFKLRDDVKFHDGKPMTAKDVVYTFKRLIDPAVGSEALPILPFLTPDGIIAVDDYTVKFKTATPVAELPAFLSTKNTRIVQEGATKESLQFTGMGTGPWIPVDYKPGQQPVKFKKNPNYWEKGLPLAECLEVYVIPEPTSRTAALQSGEIDMMQASFATASTVAKDPNLKLAETGASSSLTFSMWSDTPPFDKLEVRQALKKVIDREAMIKTALFGYGDIGNDNPVPPNSPFAFASAPPPRDVEGAKALLAKAGYGPDNPLKIDLYTSDGTGGFVAMSQLFKAQAAEAGVDVNVIVSPAGDYWGNVWLKQPFVTSTWNPRPPAEGLGLVYRQNAGQNETHFFRPDFDALLDKANAEPDEAKRTELYKQAQKILAEEGGVIIPMFIHNIYANRANCTGFDPHIQITHIDFKNVECPR